MLHLGLFRTDILQIHVLFHVFLATVALATQTSVEKSQGPEVKTSLMPSTLASSVDHGHTNTAIGNSGHLVIKTDPVMMTSSQGLYPDYSSLSVLKTQVLPVKSSTQLQVAQISSMGNSHSYHPVTASISQSGLSLQTSILENILESYSSADNLAPSMELMTHITGSVPDRTLSSHENTPSLQPQDTRASSLLISSSSYVNTLPYSSFVQSSFTLQTSSHFVTKNLPVSMNTPEFSQDIMNLSSTTGVVYNITPTNAASVIEPSTGLVTPSGERPGNDSVISSPLPSGTGFQFTIPIIVGMSLGGVALLALICIVGLSICHCRKSKKMKTKTTKDGYSSYYNAFWDDSIVLNYMGNHIELPKETSEEMISLDNDTFLASLEGTSFTNSWAGKRATRF